MVGVGEDHRKEAEAEADSQKVEVVEAEEYRTEGVVVVELWMVGVEVEVLKWAEEVEVRDLSGKKLKSWE
jgi:hypothetical protein